MRRSLLVGILILLMGASACGFLKRPDMTRMSGIAALEKPRRPLIFVHGFLGSKLRDPQTRKVAWGTMASVLLGGDSDALALATGGQTAGTPGERLEPYEIYDRLWGVEYYEVILRSLSDAGGYRLGDIDAPRPGDDAFVFVYDWRRDNVESARLLGEAISRIQSALGEPDLKFDLLTHSQGGLIARYYIKYGKASLPDSGPLPAPTMAGAAHIDKVIMLGTPNRGCLEAFKILNVGVKRVFRPIRPEIVFTMPSVFQMLPPKGTIVFSDMDGGPVDLDLYDAATWVREGWSAFSPEAQERLRKSRPRSNRSPEDIARLNTNLEKHLERMLRRTERFRQALEAPSPLGGRIAYYAFGSDCISTLRRAIVRVNHGKRELLFDEKLLHDNEEERRVAKILYGPGDGTVLMQSLLAIPDSGPEGGPRRVGDVAFDSAFFVCESHGVLPNDPIFQNNLFYLLLWTGNAS